MSSNNRIPPSDSPCVRNCCLDSDDICLGCYRHVDEIVAWRSYTSQEKKEIMAQCEQRRESNQFKKDK